MSTSGALPTVLLFILLLIQFANGQTVESLFDDCFGSGMDPQSPMRVRTFGFISAHFYQTRPEGMELVARLKPFSCIYGFLFPLNSKVDHLLFNLQSAYVREGVDVYLDSEIHVTFHIFQYVNNETVSLALVRLRPPGQRLPEMLLRVRGSELKSGPVLISMNHTVPRGVQGLRFLHMNLLVTPIFNCRIDESLMNKTPAGYTVEHTESTTEHGERKHKFFACGVTKTNDSVDTDNKITFCITADLMCDQYPNCPRYAGLDAADEHPSQCPKPSSMSSQYLLWVTPILTLPTVLLFSLILIWLYRSPQFARCRRILLKQQVDSSEECPDHFSHPSASQLEELFLFESGRRTENLVMPSCPPPQPQPPPSYHEAMEQTTTSSRQTVFSPQNRACPSRLPSRPIEFYHPSDPRCPTPLAETEFNEFWVSQSVDGGRISVSPTSSPPPPSYKQCIPTDVRSVTMNHTNCSSTAPHERTG